MIESKMKKSSLFLLVLISLLALIIYSSVSVRLAVAADPDPCWGNGKCSGSSCTTINVIFGIKETCKWSDSQGVRWSQTCSIHLTKGIGSTEVRLNGCDKSSKAGTLYAPLPQNNLTSPVNDTGNTTLPLASVFKSPIKPEAGTNNSAINNNNTSTLPTLTINKEKNSEGNATTLGNDTSILKSSHKSGGHHHHNDNTESKTNASTNSSESQKNSQLPEVS